MSTTTFAASSSSLTLDTVVAAHEQHRDELVRAAIRACRDPETAEDLVQEALLRLMLETDANGPPRNVRAWLHRVVANLAVSLGRRTTVSRRHTDALVRRDEPDTPEDLVLDLEARSELAAALAILPDRARAALLLAASGYPGAEIAAAVGRSDTATRTMICRARLKVRSQLAA